MSKVTLFVKRYIVYDQRCKKLCWFMSFRSKFNKQYADCTVYLSSRRETLDWMLDPGSISIALFFFFFLLGNYGG